MIQTKDREKIENLISFILELQAENRQEDSQYHKQIFAKLVQYAQRLGITTPPEDPEFLPILLVKILEEYQKTPELPPANTIPPELTESYEKEKQEKENKIKNTLASKKLYGDYQNLRWQVKNLIAKAKTNLSNQEVERVTDKAIEKIIIKTPAVASAEFLPKEETQKILDEAQKIIEEESQKIETGKEKVLNEAQKIIEEESQKIEAGEKQVLEETRRIIEEAWVRTKTETRSSVFTPEIAKEIPQIAASPKIIEAVKQSIPSDKRFIDLKKLALPPEIIKQIESQFAQETYSPAKTILSPQASLALAKRTLYAIPVKGIQAEVTEMQIPLKQQQAFERIKKMVFEGIFKEDYEVTYQFLQSYLPKNHPVFTYLENEINAFDEVQKVDAKNWLGRIIGRQDRPFVKALKRYYDYVKKTEKWQSFDKILGIHLKSSPKPLWAKKGYNFLVKRVVDKFQFIPRSYQKTFSFITRGRFNSFGVFLKEKAFKPILIKLGKTAFGKAVQQGTKKAAVWLATKLGIKAGIWAAGTAGAAPSAGVSLLIAAAVEIGSRILRKIKDLIIGMIRDPEKAFLSVGGGLLILFFIPMPLALIGIIPVIIGGAALVSFVLAPATLGVIGGGISTFFTVLFGASFTLPIILFFISLLAILAGLTLFIVLVVSGAFILPQQVSETTPTTISPYISDYFEISKTASDDKFENYQVEDEDGETIKYTITIKPKGNYILRGASLEEKFSVFKEGLNSLNVGDSDCQFTPQEVQEAIDNQQSLECSVNIDSRFKNSAISNSVTLTTSVEGVVGIHKGMSSAVVIVGNPPMLCPKGWPTSHGYITQGPGAAYSHIGNEAIDIGGVGDTTEVYATHQGIVIKVGYQPAQKNGKAGAGYFIRIEGKCLGQSFTSNYYHLKAGSIKVKVGDPIITFQPLGITDSSGMVKKADHLHYEFKPYGGIVKMIYDYIPKTVPRGCDGNCNISW